MSLYRTTGGGGGRQVYETTMTVGPSGTYTINCGFKPSYFCLWHDGEYNAAYAGIGIVSSDGSIFVGGSSSSTGWSSAPVFGDTGVTFGGPKTILNGHTMSAHITIIGEE